MIAILPCWNAVADSRGGLIAYLTLAVVARVHAHAKALVKSALDALVAILARNVTLLAVQTHGLGRHKPLEKPMEKKSVPSYKLNL